VAGSFEHDNKPLDPVKGRKSLGQLEEYYKSGYTFMVKKYIKISIGTTECESLKVDESRRNVYSGCL
jgi:hypothetical protein